VLKSGHRTGSRGAGRPDAGRNARLGKGTVDAAIAAPAPLLGIARRLARAVAQLELRTPSHVYNPLQYAWSGQRAYLERYGRKRGRVLLVGMNPGPWGMAQTGVPFGSVAMVRNWFGIEPRLSRRLPAQHPRYPILGMRCHRDEGSGKRLWGWAAQRFGTPERFFERFFVWNYCPLLFLAHDRNLTPAGLSAVEVRALAPVCDRALRDVIDVLQPVAVVGIGRYAEQRLRNLVGERVPVGYLPHPSPASPAANREWAAMAERALAPWLPARRSAD
jgi:single-strand selective monofunctional uracil DNA glycosylase